LSWFNILSTLCWWRRLNKFQTANTTNSDCQEICLRCNLVERNEMNEEKEFVYNGHWNFPFVIPFQPEIPHLSKLEHTFYTFPAKYQTMYRNEEESRLWKFHLIQTYTFISYFFLFTSWNMRCCPFLTPWTNTYHPTNFRQTETVAENSRTISNRIKSF
jgi:hypothetical protein